MTQLNPMVAVAHPPVCTQCEECSKLKNCLLGKFSAKQQAYGKAVARSPQHVSLAAGDTLFRRLEDCRSLFVICSGAIKTQRVTPEGDLIVTGLWLPGDILGLEALGGAECEFDAVATRSASVVRLDVEQLLDACLQTPGMNVWFTQKLGQLLRRRDVDHASFKGQNSSKRILRFFLDLHERSRESEVDQAIEGELPMHKQDIARYLDMSPETLSRSLSTLRHQQLLFVSKTHYTVPDVAHVRSMAAL